MESRKERLKQTMKDLAKNKELIPGIYNYCDRWCERCTKTRKCLNYMHEQAMKEESGKQNSDEENQDFWDQIHLTWEITMDLIQENAERMGIDLDNMPDVELPEHIETPVEIRAKNYGKMMHKWLKENREYINQKSEMMVMTNDEESVIKLKDAMEVLQWYCFFIGAKVHRASLDLDERQNDPDDEYNVYSDNLGSAKIAIIAIERSIDALSVFYRGFNEKEDELLEILVELASMKKQLLEIFPGVMDFKRPGFDD